MNIEYPKEKFLNAVLEGKLNAKSTIMAPRHYEALLKASESLRAAPHGLDTGITGDFVAMVIRRALTYFGEITGEIGTEMRKKERYELVFFGWLKKQRQGK